MDSETVEEAQEQVEMEPVVDLEAMEQEGVRAEANRAAAMIVDTAGEQGEGEDGAAAAATAERRGGQDPVEPGGVEGCEAHGTSDDGVRRQ